MEMLILGYTRNKIQDTRYKIQDTLFQARSPYLKHTKLIYYKNNV